MAKPAGLILMGGKSIRMGTDKAFVKWQSDTFLERAIKLTLSACSEFYLSVNAEQFKELSSNYPCIQDHYAETGPMGGILTALEATNKNLLVVAIDMPLMKVELLQQLLNVEEGNVRAYRGSESGFWHPLPSYWPSSSKNQLKRYVEQGEFRLQNFLSKNNATALPISDYQAFRNINSLKEL